MYPLDFVYLFIIAVAAFFIYARLRPGTVDPRVFRSRRDRMYGGVLAGLGARFGFAPLWLRLATLAVVTVFPPLLYTLVGLYLVLWAVMPRAPDRLRTITLEEMLEGTGVQPHQIRSRFDDPTKPY